MGCGASMDMRARLDKKLVEALVLTKSKRGPEVRPGCSLNELLLKFPKLAKGFKKARELFHLIDTNGDNRIDLREFTTQADKIGLSGIRFALEDVFQAADIDNSNNIDVMEFMLVFLVVHLLQPEGSATLDPDIVNTLDLVQDAFCSFDASSDGFLERAEMAHALGTTTPGRSTQLLADKLFDSLDWDGNNRISFKEFLLGLEKMVMEEYDEQEPL